MAVLELALVRFSVIFWLALAIQCCKAGIDLSFYQELCDGLQNKGKDSTNHLV